MRVLELSLRNYRVFEEVDLELPARVIGIFGENGSGKSTLMESIAFACYGADAARTKKQEIRTHGLLLDCEVRLVFEHAGRQYEVRRTIRGKGHAPEAELFGGGLQLASGTTEVDAEIRRLLHMDLHVFRSSVFAEQKQLDAFSDLRPGERKQMTLRLLGIRPVEEARTAARREARAAKESATQLAGAVADLAELEADLKEAKETAAEAERLAKAATGDLRSAVASARAARKAFDQIDATRQRVEKLTLQLRAKTEQREALVEQREALAERLERLSEEIAELPSLRAELEGVGDVEGRLRAAARLAEAVTALAAAEAELAALPETDLASVERDLASAETALAAARAGAAQARAELGQRERALAEAKERLERTAEADPALPCPTCGRPLGEDFAGYVRHCRAALSAAKGEAASAAKHAKGTAATLTKAERAHEAVVALGRRARDAREARDRLTDRLEALAEQVRMLAEPFDGVAPDVEAIRAEAAAARELAERVAELGAHATHVETLRTDLAAAEDRLAALERELTGLTEEASDLAFDPAGHERTSSELRDAEAAVETARAAEQGATAKLREAETKVSELSGALGQAKETLARVDELRSQARYVERVAMLLDGFRDHLVARVGPELSREAETLFRELTNHAYDDLRVDEETLAIQIADGDAYFPIERFSGSETDLANLALRVAISSHLSRVSGADVGLMVLDEVLGSLDEERKDLMVQALGRLAARFHQVFVITHSERVKDHFPASISVQTVGRRRSTATLV